MKTSKQKIQNLIESLLAEIEEEDIGISLFTTFYQNEEELNFFTVPDRERVSKILKQLSDDSSRHKVMLATVITRLGEKI
jgi:hypothetical protein